MIKPILGTRPGDPVTKHTPVGSRVAVVWAHARKPVFTVILHRGDTCYLLGKMYPDHMKDDEIYKCQHEDEFYTVHEVPLPWHHAAWNWLAERIGK